MACTQFIFGRQGRCMGGREPPPASSLSTRRGDPWWPRDAHSGRGKVRGAGGASAGHRLSLARAQGRWQPTRTASSPRGGVKAPKFSYVRAISLEQVLELLERYGEDAQILAGGQSLMPALNMRLSAPQLIIDINGIAALQGIAFKDGMVRIGA